MRLHSVCKCGTLAPAVRSLPFSGTPPSRSASAPAGAIHPLRSFRKEETMLPDLVQHLANLTVFAILGAVAGTAFPIALVGRRTMRYAGHYLPERTQKKRQLVFWALIAACAAIPWIALALGQWFEGADIRQAHGVAMTMAALASMTYLVRRWRLYG